LQLLIENRNVASFHRRSEVLVRILENNVLHLFMTAVDFNGERFKLGGVVTQLSENDRQLFK
jgi:hypothetical protein